MACSHYSSYRKHLTIDDLRWPIGPLVRQFNVDKLRLYWSDEQIDHWRTNGLSDVESDNVAIKLGVLPYLIWRGWYEALDWNEGNRRIT